MISICVGLLLGCFLILLLGKAIMFNKKYITKLVLFSGIISLGSMCYVRPEGETSAEHNIYEYVGNLHFPSLAKMEQEEAKIAEEIAEHNKEIAGKKPHWFSGRTDLSKVKDAAIGEVEQLKLFNQMFAHGIKESSETRAKGLLTDTTCGDLDLLCGGKPDFEKSLLATIDHTKTSSGHLQLAKMLVEPKFKCSIDELKHRQAVIKTLVDDPDLLRSIDEKLDALRNCEADVIWFTKQLEEAVVGLYDQAYWPKFLGLSALNKKEIPMELTALRTLYGVPLAEFGWPLRQYVLGMALTGVVYWLMRGDLGEVREAIRVHGVMTRMVLRTIFNGDALRAFRRATPGEKCATLLVTGLFGAVYVWPIIAALLNASAFNNISKSIQKRMIGVATYFNNLQGLGRLLADAGETIAALPEVSTASHLRAKTQSGSALLKEFEAGCFAGEPRLLTRKGKVLASFKKMFDEAHSFVDLIIAAGKIDAYVSIAKLFNKHALNQKGRYCFVDFVEAEEPSVNLTHFWHPGLNPDRAVTNSIAIGCNGTPLNMILTGPNMGGKSTALKAIVLSVILAQTLTIAPADSMQLTPFSLINTYLNIADTVGKESLYQAEMMRTKKLLSEIETLGKDEFSLVIMDEMFTGTNAQEGMAAAYGVASKMSGYKRNITLLATHFYALTDLEADIPGSYKNYKVSITKDADGTIRFPYLLEPGIADQSIALELLAREGFDKEILAAAKFASDNKHANAMAHKEIDKK